MNKDELRYQEAAEVRTVTTTEWFCKRCNRRWGNQEHMARMCCATTGVCSDCGNDCRAQRNRCRGCETLQDQRTWSAKPEHDWGGDFPIFAALDVEQYFFDLEQLRDYLVDHDPVPLSMLRELHLMSCVPCSPYTFELADLFQDCFEYDQDLPENPELEKTVNDWVKSLGTISWRPTGKRLKISQIEAAIVAAYPELAREFVQ